MSLSDRPSAAASCYGPPMAKELSFDGLVGPTFNHGGFALGNLASAKSAGNQSSPRQAVLQGIAKMRALHDLGVEQAVMPPHFRPELSLARRLGFAGDDATLLKTLLETAPKALAACYSASSMWTANAATVCPSADAADGRAHFTPANLQNQLHRSIEARTAGRILRAIFHDESRFVVHEPLPASAALGDEGAANHTRFCPNYGDPGLQLFVFGQAATEPWLPKPVIFPARQTKEASESVARLHQLDADRTLFAHQNPEVIDAGVFHNDVISVGDRDVFFFHEKSFLDTKETVASLSERYQSLYGKPLRTLEVPDAEIDVDTCVATYLFNSQLVAGKDGSTVLIAPKECEEHAKVSAFVERIVADPGQPIDAAHFHDVRQSMHGGGGPACLRLRVVLTDEELATIPAGVRFGPQLQTELEAWANRHYRDQLSPTDLADPQLLEESRVALDALTGILGLGAIYDFQKND